MQTVVHYQLFFNIHSGTGNISLYFTDPTPGKSPDIQLPGIPSQIFNSIATLLIKGNLSYDANTGWFRSDI